MITRRLRAFSMMELLLALGMVAMLTLSLYASMRVGMRARKTAQATVAPMRAATIAMDMICRDLESVPAPAGILAGPFLGMRQSAGTGEAAYMQFCCLGADGNQPRLPLREGARQVELMLRTDVTPGVLVRRVNRNLLANTQLQPEEEILCRGVRSFAVQYFDGTYWGPEWDSTAVGDVLPMAVQIVLDLEPTTGASADITPNRIVRVIPLACAKPIDTTGEDTSSTDTGSTTGGTGGGR
jgi:type II secretion system protein J